MQKLAKAVFLFRFASNIKHKRTHEKCEKEGLKVKGARSSTVILMANTIRIAMLHTIHINMQCSGQHFRGPFTYEIIRRRVMTFEAK